MRTVGEYVGATRSLDGELIISFAIDDETAIEKLKTGKQLVIETKNHSDKRSLNANAYFWVLCDKMARVLNTTKEEVYLNQLSHFGVFYDIEIMRDALPLLRTKFRFVEEFIEDDLTESEMITARCYFGSSHYTKDEMARLIDGTVQDAKELKIDTWTPEEIQRAVEMWEGVS